MTLDHMIRRNAQIQDEPKSDHLIQQNTLKETLDYFLSIYEGDWAPATLVYYSFTLSRFISHCKSQGLDLVSQVTTNHIRNFIFKLRETNNPASCHDYYRAIKRFFNWMMEEEILTRNPMFLVHPPKVAKKIIEPFKPEHIRDMIELCDLSGRPVDIRNKALILLFYDTGIRRQEMAEITIDKIDIRAGLIKIMGKGAKERLVAFSKIARKALIKYLMSRPGRSNYLWVDSQGKPLTKWGIRQIIRTVSQRAEITGVRASSHTFRHSFATDMLRNGAPIHEVKTLLGHSTLTMTMRYVSSLNSEDAVKKHKQFSPVDKLLK